MYNEMYFDQNTITLSTGTLTTAFQTTVLPAGIYIATFSSTISLDAASCSFYYILYGGAVAYTASERTTSTQAQSVAHTQYVITVNGSERISLQWQRTVGSCTASMLAKTLIVQQIANIFT